MRFNFGVFVPAPIDDVFDFLDEPSNTVALGGHASEHVQGITEVAVDEDGRRTFDFKMHAGPRSWTQTVQQVVRDRPTRLVTRGYTWTKSRDDPYLRVTTDRKLTSEEDGTRLVMAIDYDVQRLRWFALVLNWMQRGHVRLELEHQLHFLAEHFASREIQQPD